MDMGNQIEFFYFTVVNGSGEPNPDREENYATLTEGLG